MKTIAAAVVQNDSGYEGQSSVKKLFSSPSGSTAEKSSLKESSISEECSPQRLDLTPKTSIRKSSLGIIEEVDEDNVSSPSPDKDEDYIKQEDENGSFVLESDSSNEGIVEQLK